MYQPRVIEVDPYRIKFNALNPRKHGGEEYESLKSSIQEIGIVQPPLVREIAGGFYEVIDGEGRTSVAQELKLSKIKVISLGMVTDEEALTMLVTSNTVREFSFIAQCKGIAELNRKGMSGKKIAKVLGMHERNAQLYVAFGYIPDDIIQMITQNPPQGGIEVRWGLFNGMGEHGLFFAFQALLPLRQVNLGREPKTDLILDGTFDYTEVHIAVQKAIQGEIKDVSELKAYVANRKREIFESRFDQELQSRIKSELDRIEYTLKESAEREKQETEERIKHRYADQVEVLQTQLKSLEQEYSKAIENIARRPDEQDVLNEREQTLLDTLEAVEKERKRVERERDKVEQERNRLKEIEQKLKADAEKERAKIIEQARKEAEQKLKELDGQLEQQAKEKLKEQEKRYREQEKSLQEYYNQKNVQLKSKATATVQQMCASGVEHLAQAQQWILHLTSPEVLSGVKELGQAELVALLAQMRVVYDLLAEVQENIQHGENVSNVDSSEIVSDSVSSDLVIYEGSLSNGNR